MTTIVAGYLDGGYFIIGDKKANDTCEVEKLMNMGTAIIGFAGPLFIQQALQSIFVENEYDVSTNDDVFASIMDWRETLKASYGVSMQTDEHFGLELMPFELLIVTPNGIYQTHAAGEITKPFPVGAIGSGAAYALGYLYDRPYTKDAFHAAIRAAAYYDKKTSENTVFHFIPTSHQ